VSRAGHAAAEPVPRLRAARVAPDDRNERTDHRLCADSAEPADSADPTDTIEPTEPILAIDASDPTLATDNTEPLDVILRTESVDRKERSDDPLLLTQTSSPEG
jgi:hypothetical protein